MDFAGMWHREYSELHECALSRTRYIITYCGCPIYWASKLQSEITLSATESKYIFMYEVIFVYVLFSTFSYGQAHNCDFLWPDIHIFRKLTSLILF
jgi:hypothetical protein